MHILESLERIVTFIVGVGVLVAYLAWKWKRAGDVSEAEAAERKAARESFEQLKDDAHFLHLLRYLHAKYRTAFEPAPDAVTYRIRYIGLMDERYGRLFAPDRARARYLVVYLQRRDNPARIQATLDLQSGACGDMAMGALGWDGLIPLMY